MAPTPGPVRRLWLSWKMMRLPWRRKWLVGFDLEGNTFWESKDQLHAMRNRRIMKPSKWTHHSDVKVPPQWAQWLRHTRFEAPTLTELQTDVVRQQRIKMLAAEADARWAAKESALDAPDKQQPIQMLESRDPRSGLRQSNIREAAQEGTPAVNEGEMPPSEPTENRGDDAPTLNKRKVMKREPKNSPWKQAQQTNPGEDWQPQQWAPKGPARRR